ncbi:MAG: TIGR02206 family membrane protein [Planctomycetes bacterium]|nr:TIGR02206 family membrane protein [Planctomycetota bacterium]
MHDTLAPLTPLWLKALAALLLVIVAIVLAGVRSGSRGRDRLALILGVFLLGSELLFHPYLASRGLWKIGTCLPLHLCDLTAIFSWVALLWRNQKVYECLFYWGIPGAIISLATPEFTLAPGVINADGTLGGETLVFLHYYISHGGILAAALYLTFALGMRPGRGSWWKISLLGQPMLLAIGMINWILDTNYVFLCEPPLVASALIIGGWPWYVLGMIILMVVASLILYLPFGLKYHGDTTGAD